MRRFVLFAVGVACLATSVSSAGIRRGEITRKSRLSRHLDATNRQQLLSADETALLEFREGHTQQRRAKVAVFDELPKEHLQKTKRFARKVGKGAVKGAKFAGRNIAKFAKVVAGNVKEVAGRAKQWWDDEGKQKSIEAAGKAKDIAQTTGKRALKIGKAVGKAGLVIGGKLGDVAKRGLHKAGNIFEELTKEPDTESKEPAVSAGATCATCMFMMEILGESVGQQQSEEEMGSVPTVETQPSFVLPPGGQPMTHDAIAGPGFQMFLETAEQLQKIKAGATNPGPDPAFLETGSRQQFIGGLKSAAGLASCRPSVKYCRPRMLQMGVRAAQRQLRMQTEAKEQDDMQGAMGEELVNLCATSVPKNFLPHCKTMGASLPMMAGEFLHDYSNDEICMDIGMCGADQLHLPTKQNGDSLGKAVKGAIKAGI